jgi:hypothetical protein
LRSQVSREVALQQPRGEVREFAVQDLDGDHLVAVEQVMAVARKRPDGFLQASADLREGADSHRGLLVSVVG